MSVSLQGDPVAGPWLWGKQQVGICTSALGKGKREGCIAWDIESKKQIQSKPRTLRIRGGAGQQHYIVFGGQIKQGSSGC